MNMSYLEQSLIKLGLVVVNQTEFEKYIENFPGGATAFLERINIKKGLLERKVDYNYFENEIITFLKDVQKYLSEDQSLKKSYSYLKEQYNVIIKNIINNNIIGLKIEQAKKLSDKLLAEIIELDIKLTDLENESTLEEKEKTVKSIELNIEKSDLEKRYHDALSVIENEKVIREKMQGRDFNELVDKLNKDIEDLKSVIDKLELSSETKNIINVIVSSYIGKFTTLKVNKNKAIKDYNDLLKEASLRESKEITYDENINKKEEYVSLDDAPAQDYSSLNDTQLDEEEIVDDLTSIDSLVGTNLVYTGKVSLEGDFATNDLGVGKTFKVVSISKDENNMDQVELEGLTGKYSLLYFETEDSWNNYLKEIEEYKVNSVIETELDKIDMSINSIAGLIANGKIVKPVKKYGINTLIEKTNGISKKNLPIFKKITEILDERKKEREDYNPSEPLINAEEFAQEYEEVKSTFNR